MIGLQYIMKVRGGWTYKKLAEELQITPPTIMAWLSGKRPIPKSKLTALAHLFGMEEHFFAKVLSEKEKLAIQLAHLEQLKLVDNGGEDEESGQQGTTIRWIDPYEQERLLTEQELELEILAYKLRLRLYEANEEVPEKREGQLDIFTRMNTLMGVSPPAHLDDDQLYEWAKYQADRQGLVRMLLFLLVEEPGAGEKPSFAKRKVYGDLKDVLKKHGLVNGGGKKARRGI